MLRTQILLTRQRARRSVKYACCSCLLQVFPNLSLLFLMESFIVLEPTPYSSITDIFMMVPSEFWAHSFKFTFSYAKCYFNQHLLFWRGAVGSFLLISYLHTSIYPEKNSNTVLKEQTLEPHWLGPNHGCVIC